MKHLLIAVACIFSLSTSALAVPPDFGFKNHGKVFDSGYLKVSDLHEIYYEASGNPKGKPVMFLHGGPGSGMSPNSRGLFNPEKFKVILFDQRGSGKSRPQFEIRENNTQELIEDVEKLRVHLGLEKIMIVGGSWGATLALAYAEKYPQNVSGMVLRAIFLGMPKEGEYTYGSDGLARYFPEVFEKMVKEINPGESDIDAHKLMSLLKDKNNEVAKKYAKLWSYYEIKITSLNAPDELVNRIVESNLDGAVSLAILETHFVTNKWFLKKDQLMKNAYKLAGIPVVLINGRYDMMTPPVTAHRLARMIPDSKLYIVESAGHSDWEMPIAKQMLASIAEFE